MPSGPRVLGHRELVEQFKTLSKSRRSPKYVGRSLAKYGSICIVCEPCSARGPLGTAVKRPDSSPQRQQGSIHNRRSANMEVMIGPRPRSRFGLMRTRSIFHLRMHYESAVDVNRLAGYLSRAL